MTTLVPAADAPLAAASIVVGFAVAGVYLYVGTRLAERPVRPTARLASLQLALWWGGLGVSGVLAALELSFAVANLLPVALAATLYLLAVLVDVAFLWGLVGFLVYVYTGKYHLVELTAVYSVFYAMILYFVFVQQPISVHFVAGAPALVYARTAPLWLEAPIVLILLGPELVGAVLYLSLFRRTRDHDQRVRILLVGGGILLWLLIDLFFPSSSGALVLAKNVVQVVPGLMSFAAFYPPEWLRRRFGFMTGPAPSAESPEAVTRG